MSRFTRTTRRGITTATVAALATFGLGLGPAATASAAPQSSSAALRAATVTKPVTKPVTRHPAGGVIKPTRKVSAVDVLARKRGASAFGAGRAVLGVSSASTLAANGLAFATRSVAAAPATDDLRDDQSGAGDTLLPPVGNQGSLGSCLPWTVAHTLMGYYANRDGKVGAPFAPLYLYLMNTSSAPSSGTNPEQVLEHARTLGVDTQSDYFQGYYDYKVKPTAAQKANAANYKVSSWKTLWAGGNTLGSTGVAARRALVQDAISTGNPVIMGFDVYTSFDAINSSALYTTNTGMNRGGHMVTLVAYDTEGATLRNQWGTGWGDHGDARVSWDWIGNHVFAAYTISGITTPDPASAAAKPKATILSMSATKGSAAGGTTVTLTGQNLVGTSKVNFGSASAVPSAVTTTNGITRVTVTTPAGSIGTQFVTVTNAGGDSATSTKAKFSYTPVPPTVGETPLSATQAATEGGTSVTVNGMFLDGATVVLGKSAVPAKAITARSNSFITFTAPPHLAGDVAVSVKNKGGVAAFGTLTYVPGNPPVITSLSASSAGILWTDAVTVTGTALDQVKKAVVAGKQVSFTKVSDTELVLRLPKMKAPASGHVVLSSKWSSSATSSATAFAWVTPTAPTLAAATGLTANTAGTATLTGTGLNATTKVALTGPTGKVYAGSRIVVAAGGGSLTFTSPLLPAGAYTVTVTNPAGTSEALAVTIG